MAISRADLGTGPAESRSPAWFPRVSRAAFAAKGVLYLVLAAVTVRPDLSNPSVFSRVLLGALGLGLVASAAYKLVEAVAHPDVTRRNGAEPKVMRFDRVLASLVYAGLAFVAFEHAARPAAHVEGVHWTARFLEEPSGPLLTVVAGAAAMGFGLHQLYRAFSADRQHRLDRSRMSTRDLRLAVIAGGIAYVGRGIAFGAVGLFLVEAAVHFDYRTSPHGLPGYLETLHETAQWEFGIVAAAMAAYGLFSLLVLARFSTPR